MKYLVDKFSMNMFIEDDLIFKRHKLDEEEFMYLTQDAYSCVASEDIANILGVAFNPEYVRARVGDIIFVANMHKGVLEFYCIQVCPNTHPLLRTTEAVEELI